jgi:fatty acid amide hydrolase 2
MRASRILTSSAVALRGAIAKRELRCIDVVEAHIARIRRVNPTINALVVDRFDEARKEARAADERVSAMHPDDLPPLFGVPFTAKDALASRGLPHTSGHWGRRNVIADKDATGVERLKRAGAIQLGVTNISELCMWMESSNKIWGRTNNPYDPTRTSGGSSGGEGALVGAGGVPIGLGSDVGGSIRMPAFFNGVFGHKPTGGLVPNTGHYPTPVNRLERYVTTGPIARRAEDLYPFLAAVAGPDGIERSCIEVKIEDPAKVDVAKLTVHVVPDNGLFEVSAPMRAAQERAAEALASRGARIVRTTVKGLRRSIEIWSAMLHLAGGPSFRTLMAEGAERFSPLVELARLPFGRSRYTFPGIALALLEVVPERMKERTERLAALGPDLRRELEELVGDDGVILFPSYPTVAPRHNMALLPPLKWVYTAIFNVLEMPVTQVPLGVDDQGLPLGVQVAARNARDDLGIAVAIALERACGGWVPPPRWPLDATLRV